MLHALAKYLTSVRADATPWRSEDALSERVPGKQVRVILLETLREHEAVLPAPAPGVTLDGIENGLRIFQATRTCRAHAWRQACAAKPLFSNARAPAH